MAMRFSIIVVIQVLLIFFVPGCCLNSITPKEKKGKGRLLITNKKTIKLQNGKKINKKVKKKQQQKQLITKNVYIPKLQHRWAK